MGGGKQKISEMFKTDTIELRGAHLKLDDLNGKQVLLYIQYSTCH
jgi:hypothetical protein